MTTQLITLSLQDLVNRQLFEWPQAANCATQEQDGSILFWGIPINQVRATRALISDKHKFIEQLGFDSIKASIAFVGDFGDVLLSYDWQTSVIDHADYTEQ
ncbi:hypothetical protein ACPV5G_18255 [Photobacterium damselae]|uniref:hypothetical protein n=1 Tax=Photobacterium damselae TaxID=38293 RepID=UPI0040680EE9